MCGFFPFTPLPCSQPCLQSNFGLGVGSSLWELPQQDVPGAQVVFQLNVSQTCPKCVPNVSQMCWQWLVGPWDWQWGVLGGSCWPAPAPAPAAGNGASRGWGRVDVILLTWDPPIQCPAPHGHEGDDCPVPLSPLQHLLPSALTGLVAADCCFQPGKGLGWGLELLQGHCLLVWEWSQTCYSFSSVYFCLDSPFPL